MSYQRFGRRAVLRCKRCGAALETECRRGRPAEFCGSWCAAMVRNDGQNARRQLKRQEATWQTERIG